MGTAIQCIYRDLEYAKSLIPPAPKAGETVEDAANSAAPTSDTARPSFEGGQDSSRTAVSDAEWDMLSGKGSNAEGDQTWDMSSHASSAPSMSPQRQVSAAASRSMSRDRKDTSTAN